MATIVKAAVFIAFIRLFDDGVWSSATAMADYGCHYYRGHIFIGNITAVFQQSVKRMLAYSSIAQAGFMLLSIYAMNADAKEGLFYIQLHIALPPSAFLPSDKNERLYFWRL